MDKYDLTATIDGNDAKDVLTTIAKDNKNDVEGTATGVLTQVFVNDDDKEAVVVEINTYLGIADSDYSEKKDEVSFDVYGVKKTGNKYEKAEADVTIKVSGEDFDVSKVEEDDAYLFTVAAGEVQTLVPAETVKDTEITSFKTGSNVTAGGTKYSFNAAAYYDKDVLKQYTNGTITNLKDTTYNIYLDTYGNLIGLEEVDSVDNYVFITGADQGNSNLSTKTTDANAIFLDGTSKVIEVSTTKGNGGTVKGATLNKWYTYTVDKNGVYTLKSIVESNYTTDSKVGQYHQTVGANETVKIDKKNVSLKAAGEFKVVYGNADTVYLTANLKKVVNNGTYAVIADVDNVTTGVKNASIELWTEAEAQKDVDKNNSSWAGTSSGVYTLYKDNGYVIAAVVVGDDAAATKNLVYSHKSDVELESYDKNADEWSWTRKVIDAKGQEITLTEKSDSLTELVKMNNTTTDKTNRYAWYQVKYDAQGNVISVEKAAAALSGYERITYFSDIQNAIDAKDTVLLERGTLTNKLSLKGSTLYDNTDGTRGVAVDDETNVVFIQTNNNKETTSFENGVKAVENALKNLNVVSETKDSNGKTVYTYNYQFSAIIEDGIATTIVIRDQKEEGYTPSTPATKADYTFDGLTAYVNPANGAIEFTTATCAAISTWDLGTPATVEYTISVNGGAARTYKQTLTSIVAMSDLADTMTVPGLTVKNGSNLEINVMVTFTGTNGDANTYTVSGTCYIA